MTDLADMTQAEKVAYWTTGYRLWKALLAGEKGWQAFSDSPCAGFWRKPVLQRDQNGNNKRVGWTPVAIFRDSETMVGRVGNEDMTGDSLATVWTHCLKHPVSEEAWRDVVERGLPWHDAKDADIPAANRDVSKADNAPAYMDGTLPVTIHAEAIDAAIGAAFKTVTTEVEAAQALGSKNRIAELRLAADKHGKSIYEPLFREYQKVQKAWAPMIARATATEKEINIAILTFREKERQRIAAETAAAEQRQRELDEANARAADRAIARGEPEPIPEVEEVVVPTAAAPIAPTYGSRKLREELKKFAVIEDSMMAFFHFRNDLDLMERLQKLCTDAIRAGETVPGVSVRESLL